MHPQPTNRPLAATWITFLVVLIGITFSETNAFGQGKGRDKVSSLVTSHQALKARPPGRAMVVHQKLLRELGVNADVLSAEECALYCEKRLTPAEITALAARGIRINPDVWVAPVAGKHSTGFHLASVDYASLDLIRADPRFVLLESTEAEAAPQDDLARIMINADDVQGGIGVTARTGAGVKIAVADSGLDVTHGDIPAPVEAYDMTDGTGTASWGTNVANTVSAHGTHVTGTAVGSGVLSSGLYKGAAPGASLYFYKIGNDTTSNATFTDMIEAINRAVTVGAKIFSMSYGGTSTYMDGSETVEQAIDSAVASGMTVLISAGNDAAASAHDSISVAPSTTSASLGFSVTNTSTTAAYTTVQTIRVIWRDGSPGDANLTLACTNLGAGETLTQTFSGSSSRSTDAKIYNLTPNIAASGSKTYTFTLQNTASSGTTPLVHLYRASGIGTFTSPDSSYTVGTPALADSAIAVGAWTQRRTWFSSDGGSWHYADLTVGTLAPFSSRGPRIDGVTKPTFVAPGAATISARESVGSLAATASLLIDNDGVFNNGPVNYYIMRGTSMACPLAAGAAALLLEHSPSMTPAQVRQTLTSTASSSASPNNSVGSGLIDILAAIQSTAAAPALASIEGTPLSYTENQAASAITATLVVTDPDSANLTGGSVSISSGLSSSQDVLSLSPNPQNGITGAYNSTTGVLTLTGSSSPANYQAAFRAVSYENTSDSPSTTPRSIVFTASDGSFSGAANRSISITATNDAPSATDLAASESYTEDTVLNLTDIVVTDPDSTITAMLTLSNTAAGTLSTATSGAVTSTYTPGTGVWSASGALANVNILLAGVTFTPTLNFNANFTIATSISDGVATAQTGTKSITGTPVNDAPSATNLSATQSYTEDTVLNLTDIVVNDVDSANVTATLTISNPSAGALTTTTSGAVTSTYNAGTGVWSAAGPIANVNALLAAVSFSPTLNFNAGFTITTSVSDGVATAVTGSKTMTGIPVNDAPFALNMSTPQTYVEDTPFDLVNVVVSDVDNASLTVTMTLSNTAAGSLSTATSGAVTSTYNAGTGVWTASGLISNVNTLLAGVIFTPALNFNANFLIATNVTDGPIGIGSNRTMTGTPVNDAPFATNLSAPETYTEDTALILTPIAAGDVDSASVSATLTLSTPAAGSLSTGTSGAVTSTYVSGTGVWTASGAIADVNALLAAVTLSPAADFSASFSIATTINDGSASTIGSKSVTGMAVNDAPTGTNLSAAESYTEDTALNLIDIQANDVDSANLTATLTLSNPAAGSLSTGTSGSVTSTYVAGTGVWTASGAITDVNTLLASVTFTPAANFDTSFTLSTSLSDGVAAAATGTKSITAIPVNDAPTATQLSVAESYTEDTTLNLVDIVASDLDSASLTAMLTVSNPVAGSLNTGTSGAVTSTYVAGTGVWTASGAIADVNALLASVTFTPAENFSAGFTIFTSLSDGVAPAITGTKSVSGIPVNDAPTGISLSNATLGENSSANTLVGNLSASDPDAGSMHTFALQGGAGGEDNASFSISGTELRLIPSANFEAKSSYNVLVRTTDNGAPGLTFDQALTVTITDVNESPTGVGLSNATLAENNGANATVGTLTASDPDGGSSHTFALQTGTGGEDNASFSISGTGLLLTPAANFEAKSSYSVFVRTTDNGAPGLTFDQAFTVTITDVNEAPTSVGLSNATLAENNAANATVGNLTASDPDAASSHTFALQTGPGGADNASFSISGTGLLLTPTANFEAKSSYHVLVRTTDNGTPGLTFDQALTVTITDVNEAPSGVGLSNATLAENNAPNATIGTLTASDPDAGSSHTFALQPGAGGEDNASFSISGTGLALTPTANFEAKSSYSVLVRTTDNGTPGLTFDQAFTVTITDVNEAPTGIGLSNATLAENNAANATVGALTAADPDAGSSHTFALQTGPGGEDNASFSISGTGLLLTPAANFEAKSSYSVLVRTTDNGAPGLAFDQAFTVTITDVNEAPTNIGLSNASLAENNAANATVGTLTASDPDAASSHTFALQTGPGGEDNASFSISGTGLLLTPTANFEAKSSYSVLVRTTDNGTPGLTFDQALTVTITDVNEAPTNIGLSNASLAENNAANATVGTLTASDPDAGSSHTFALQTGVGGEDNASFSISGTGLRLTPSANFEAKSSYHVLVRTTDNGTPGLTFDQAFTVTITDVNEAPVFTKGSNQFHDPRTNSPQTVTGWTSAFDDGDSLATQSLTFNLTVDSSIELFTTPPAISSTGQLTYTPNGTAGTATVNVTLTDDDSINGTPALTTVAQSFTITITQAIIALRGNSETIANGDITPSNTDHTDFGEMTIASGTVPRTFTIENSGDGILTIGSIQIGGAGAGDFAVTALPTTPVAATTGSTTFQVTFDPSATGPRDATLTFATNDANDDPFVFAIRGTGTAPEIIVDESANTNLVDGTASIDFGDVLIAGGGATRSVTIRNGGTAPLNGLAVIATGPDSADVSLGALGATTLAPTEETTFTVTFAPGALGSRSAALEIASNDADENPFDITLAVNGVEPDISIEANSTLLVDGTSTITFPTTAPGESAPLTVTVRNTGTGLLSGLAVSLTSGDFSAGPPAVTSLPPGGSTTFEVTFDPTVTGARNGSIQVASSDPDENPYNLTLAGFADFRAAKMVSSPASEATPPTAADLAWENTAAGLYDGLLRDQTDGTTILGAISALRVTAPKIGSILGGAVSATVRLNGKSATLRGSFDSAGLFTVSLPQRDGSILSVALQLRRTQPGNGEAIQGTVSWYGVTALADLPRAPFHPTLNPIPPSLAATGLYTLLLPSLPGWGDDEPGGDGWATGSLSTAGVLSLAITLGDGTKFTETSYLSAAGETSLYAELYAKFPGKGRVAGKLVFRDQPGISDFDGVLRWNKGFDIRVPQRELLYPNGFNLAVTAIGCKFTPPVAPNRILAQLANQNHNAELSLIGPTAPSSTSGALDRVVSWFPTHKIQHYGPQSLAASASAKTGSLSGSFYDPATRKKVSFTGVSFQKQGLAAGNFINGVASGAVRIVPGITFDYPGSESAGALARIAVPSTAVGAPLEILSALDPFAAGSYIGTLSDGVKTTGALDAVKVTSTGAISGAVWIEGVRQSFSGVIGSPITASGGALLNLTLSKIDETADGFGLSGTVEAGGNTYTADGQRRPVFTKTLRAPQEGKFTAAMLAPELVDVSAEPGGDGYGTVNVSYLGSCTGLITLADGTKVTLAGHTGRQYNDAGNWTAEWSFHAGLYGRTPMGYLAGKLTFRENIEGLSDLDGEWRWVKKSGAAPITVYPAGFDVVREIVGSRYVTPLAGIRAMDGLANDFYNIWFRLAGPDLSTLPADITSLDRAATWTTANKLVYYGPEKVSLSFSTTTGLLTGSYVDTPSGISIKFGGVLIQDQDLLSGSYVSQGKSGLFSVERR